MKTNNTASILGRRLEIREYNNQRVITFADIDFVHDRPEGTARKRFNDNRKHFIKDIDYFLVTPNDPMSEKRTLGEIPPKGITLLTESGYLLLVKSFTDDVAWHVQRQLVNAYFRFKEQKQPKNPPKLEEPYTYTEKKWNGQIVATIRDLHEIWKDISRYSIRYAVKQHLILNTDYFDLKGAELSQFKQDCLNDKTVKKANELFVVTYSGLKKLAKLLCNGDFEPIKKFKLPEPKTEPVKTLRFGEIIDVLDVPVNPEIQKILADIHSKATAVHELANITNMYHNSMEAWNIKVCSLYDMSQMLYRVCDKLHRVTPKIIQKNW